MQASVWIVNGACRLNVELHDWLELDGELTEALNSALPE
jgi:hypothetical protein